MLGSLVKAFRNPLSLLGIVLLCVTLFIANEHSYFMYLTVAQLVFVPTVVQLIVRLKGWEQVILAVGMVAVTVLCFEPSVFLLEVICAALYFLATCIIAKKGLERFLNRGFTNLAEIMIDAGFLYVAIGGAWYFAYIAQIDTGFSPIITWLTAIHFHYSGFMLCVSLGLFGRLYTRKLYEPIALIIVSGPLLVALGITFSTVIEIVSVTLYVVAIFMLFIMTFQVRMPLMQAISIRLTIGALCFTIIWSFLYAYGNFSGQVIVDIPNMLDFHGRINCFVFGVFTVIGWAVNVPPSKQQAFTFPVSQIRGELQLLGDAHRGLVDRLSDFVDTKNLPESITQFYEQTTDYQLFSSVKWRPWFKPFAFIYQWISRRIEQLNLPFHSDVVEMTGTIHLVDEHIDKREKPRVWKRTINDKTVFVAIYSKHTSDGKTYMNIALPLPFSTMMGILSLEEQNGALHLVSKGAAEAGVYLAIGRYTFKLPLEEHFIIQQKGDTLIATHDMTIFGLHFLHIDYTIHIK
ncbi:MAG: YndJ family protein [Lysinibacillus sp.]